MKKYLNLSIFLLITSANAQISFGKETINGNSTILDFNDDINNVKGIILPSITNTNSVKRGATNENGILFFDKEERKIKAYENDTWRSLSKTGNSVDLLTPTNAIDQGKGIIIGSETTTAEGVLILESENMAMILPKIENPNLKVSQPYPGMICYDTNSKSLAVYNGVEWTYW